MRQSAEKPAPADWEITATTLRCDRVDEMVTITVTRDWNARCSWYRKHKEPDPKTGGKNLEKCDGPGCPTCSGYRNRLMDEEKP